MFKKAVFTSIIFVVVMALSACSSTAIPTLNASSITSGISQVAGTTTVQNKLGVGILQLEGTELAVSTDQASELLPLWKAVKSLDTDDNTSDAEIVALYQQIEETLTTEQVQAIEKQSLSQSDLDALMEEYSVEENQGSSLSTSTQASVGGAEMGGGDMGGGADMMGAGMDTTAQVQQASSTTRVSSDTTSELNVLFADAVVTVLKQSVAA